MKRWWFLVLSFVLSFAQLGLALPPVYAAPTEEQQLTTELSLRLREVWVLIEVARGDQFVDPDTSGLLNGAFFSVELEGERHDFHLARDRMVGEDGISRELLVLRPRNGIAWVAINLGKEWQAIPAMQETSTGQRFNGQVGIDAAGLKVLKNLLAILRTGEKGFRCRPGNFQPVQLN